LSYKFPDDRKRSLAAWLLLESVLGRETAFCIRRYDKGKPYIDGGPHFSVSHSGDWAVLAVCEKNIGFDIERINAACNTGLVASRAFWPEEVKTVGRDVNMFYRIWTAKESYLKMKACFPAGISGFCVQFEGGAGRIKDDPGIVIHFFEQFDGYAAALCSPAGREWPRERTVLAG
jgi:hypothetical protein